MIKDIYPNVDRIPMEVACNVGIRRRH